MKRYAYVLLSIVSLGSVFQLVGCAKTTGPISAVDAERIQTAGDDRIHHLLGSAYAHLNENDDIAAEKVLQEARRLDPLNPWVALNLGVILQRRGSYDLARVEYMAATAAKGGDVIAASASEAQGSGMTVAQLGRLNLSLLDKKLAAEARQVGYSGKITADERNVRQQELFLFLENWRSAWSSRDISSYIATYSPAFKGDYENRKAWEKARQQIIANSVQVQITVDDVAVEVSGDMATLTFSQKYSSSTFRDKGIKELLVKRSAEKWQIVRESFNSSGLKP